MTTITNFDELKADVGIFGEAQELTDDGAITIKDGDCALNKSGVISATLAAPTDETDDYKRLNIVSLTGNAHTVTATGRFGNGGSGEDIATFSDVIGDALSPIAYHGYRYITGTHQVSIA